MFERAPDVTEPIEGISVLQAADAEAEGGVIQITDRSQVLDGLVRHGDDLLIVIETKLEGRVSSRQAQYLNVHGAQVHFNGPVKAVDWRELLAIWSALVETNVVAGAERSLIEDFLIYVERHFPRLGPFRTLSQCRENASRITMRLNAVLDEMAEGLSSTWLELPGRSAVDRAFLEFDVTPQRIRLVIYPADTLTQATPMAPADAGSNVFATSIQQQTFPAWVICARNESATEVRPEHSGPTISLMAPTGRPPRSKSSSGSIRSPQLGASSSELV
jgi:hypothetical protein